MTLSSDASHATTGCFCCKCSQPLQVQINEQKKQWHVGGDGTCSVRLCGKLHKVNHVSATYRLHPHLDDFGCHPIAI